MSMSHAQAPEVVKATMEQRYRRTPRTGVRRSARLISLQIQRSREHRR